MSKIPQCCYPSCGSFNLMYKDRDALGNNRFVCKDCGCGTVIVKETNKTQQTSLK